MNDRITRGHWFDVATEEQHTCLKRYGKTEPPSPSFLMARVQKGNWAGPGRYMLLSYQQRCPRNCCDDTVHEVLSAAEVIEEVREEIMDLAAILREAKRS